MYPIASVTSPSGGTVAFNNIPQTFTHLQVRAFVRSAYGGSGGVNEDPFFRFNGNSYTFAGHSLQGNGSSAISTGYTGISYGDMSVGMANNYLSSNIFGAYIFDILDYTNTNKYKTIRMIGGYDANGSGDVRLSSSLLQSTDAITSISQFGGTATSGFVAGSTIQLYGITTA